MPGTRATLDPEWSLLVTACSVVPRPEKLTRIRSLLQQPVRWARLFDLADRHGIQPLVYRSLIELEDAVPAAEMQTLKQSYQTNLHKALLLSRELIRIHEHLSVPGIEVMPYKGLALAETLYGDIALRQSGDIDLLIHPLDLARIRDAVRDLGYTPHVCFSEAEEREYLRSGYECVFDGAAGPNLLELQWAIQPRFYSIDFDMSGLFARAVTVSVAGHPIKSPSPSDLLLILSVHAAKHVWGRLVWLCDIAHLTRRPDLDWDWIASQARELGVLRILQVTILAANRLLGAAVPDVAQNVLPNDPAVPALADEIQTHITSQTAYDVESSSYFHLMLRLRERLADRRRFLVRLALTPGPGEWNAVRLPPPMFPLYRLIRLARLAARFVRA
jgi:hypothetical protein